MVYNEFYYDEAKGMLYYYSTSGVGGKTFTHASSDYLLMLDGVKNITIDGFSFTGTDDYYMTVYGHNGTLGAGQIGGVKYEGDTYRAGAFPRRSAIYMNDVENALITNCDFYELGCEGITARGWMKDVTVENNTFENIGAAGIRFGENIREYEAYPWVDGCNTFFSTFCFVRLPATQGGIT